MPGFCFDDCNLDIKCSGCSDHPDCPYAPADFDDSDSLDSFPVGYIGGDLEDYYNSVALVEVEGHLD